MAQIKQVTCIACGTAMRGLSCVHGKEICEKGLKPQREFELDEERLPNPGDSVICIMCGHLQAFDENLQLRSLTPAEEIEMAGNPAMLIIQRSRASFMREHGPDAFVKESEQAKKKQ